MDITSVIPNVPLEKYKRTKIIATVGPATNSYEAIHGLIAAGANGLRLNFSHGTYDERSQQIEWIRKASKELGKPVAIIQDLQGPKIRLGDFEGVRAVEAGQEISFLYKAAPSSQHFPTQYDLSKKVKVGERIYIYDGKIHTVVTKIKKDVVYAEVENDGMLVRRKGINLPDTDFSGDILTTKDKEDIKFGAEHDIDFVALSFVQTADDVRNLRKILKYHNSTANIISKVETKAAVDNLEEIVEESDAVMIARGDLAIETSTESVPIVQRKIIGLGRIHAKPTIVATQMLQSMTETPEPTRAEASDVATAVAIGTDAVMLSDETANGNYPIQTVNVMKRIILYTESNLPLKVRWPGFENKSIQGAISRAIINLAENIKVSAIVAETNTGATAMVISSHRPEIPLIAVTNKDRTAQQLSIVFGVKSYIRPAHPQAAQRLTDWLRKNDVLDKGDVVVSASGKYPGVVGTTDTIKVRILE